MTNILDTVKIFGWVRKSAHNGVSITRDYCFLDDIALYSRETVERLLAEHRKQVLLEAAGKYLKNDDDLLMREYVADWLRSMAEGEK